MRTWSLERALDGLVCLGNIAGISASDILGSLWPTPVDPAEQLAEREAEEEVAEPRYTQADVDEMVQTTWAARNLDEVKSHTCIACHAVWYDEDHEHQCPTLQDAEPKFAPMPCCGGVLFHHHCTEADARRAADDSGEPRLAVHIGEDGHLHPPDAVLQRFTVGVKDGQPYDIGRDFTLGAKYGPCPKCGETHVVGEPCVACFAESTIGRMQCCGELFVHADTCPENMARLAGVAEAKARIDADGPNPCEPALSDDELVAVRGLIQERYGEPDNSSSPPWGVNPGDESAPHSQAVASPAGVASPPDPAPAGHFNGGWDRAQLLVPSIRNILVNHQFRVSGERCDCGVDDLDYYDWRAHVAPLIAVRIAELFDTQPK